VRIIKRRPKKGLPKRSAQGWLNGRGASYLRTAVAASVTATTITSAAVVGRVTNSAIIRWGRCGSWCAYRIYCLPNGLADEPAKARANRNSGRRSTVTDYRPNDCADRGSDVTAVIATRHKVYFSAV
jgi:hypothetical protein